MRARRSSQPIRRELDRLRDASALAREQLAEGIVELLPPGADAGAWGAVTIAAARHAGIGGRPTDGRRWATYGRP